MLALVLVFLLLVSAPLVMRTFVQLSQLDQPLLSHSLEFGFAITARIGFAKTARHRKNSQKS